MSTGRDVFLRRAVPGRLYPLGHPAVRTLTIEREFSGGGLTGTAVLRKHVRVSITKGRMPYSSPLWPFTSVEILDDASPTGSSVTVAGDADYMLEDGKPYQYKCRGIDRAGLSVEFTMPLIFVPDTLSATHFANIVNAYTGNSTLSRVSVGRVNVVFPAPRQERMR